MQNMSASISIAPATESDIPILLKFIYALAEYEKLSAACQVIARSYRWSEIARDTVQHYREALGSLGKGS